MITVRTLSELRQHLAGRAAIAHVPTMGHLHDGHLALVRRARELGEFTVASIFVNRLQFLPHEDFDTYPRDLCRDADALRDAGCDLLFAPDEAELYPEPQAFTVRPDPALADILEGEYRPGFFVGVCTVLTKFFACVQPRVAVFGKKDYQQWRVVRQLVRQLSLPMEIVGVETQRAADGLALSSRNAYLTPAERREAPMLQAVLRQVEAQVRRGRRAFRDIETDAIERLRQRGWVPDYVALRCRDDLRPAQPGAALVVLGAARLGRTRLIDNLEIGELA